MMMTDVIRTTCCDAPIVLDPQDYLHLSHLFPIRCTRCKLVVDTAGPEDMDPALPILASMTGQ